MFNHLNQQRRNRYFSREKQKAFLEDLTLLLQDNMTVQDAIEKIQNVSDGVILRVAMHIARYLKQGKQLADGMQGWFSRPLVEMVREGEKNGRLVRALKSVIYSYSQESGMGKRFLMAIMYPFIIIFSVFIMLIFARHSVLDDFLLVRPLNEWPRLGQHLYHLSFFTEHWGWFIVIVIGLMAYILSRLLQQLTGKLRSKLDSLPGISLYRDLTAAYFMEMLGLLISNDIRLKEALRIMHRDAVPYLSWHILKMEYRLDLPSSNNMAEILDTNLIAHHDMVRLRAVANSKGFEHVLINLGRQANQRATKWIEYASKVSGGFLLALSALMTLALVLGIYFVGHSIN